MLSPKQTGSGGPAANARHQVGDRSCFLTHYSFLRFRTLPWLAKYSLENYVKKTNHKRFYINDFYAGHFIMATFS
jgi:hypothetical protein